MRKYNIITAGITFLAFLFIMLISGTAFTHAQDLSPDIAVLNYTPINFEEILSKPKIQGILTERDPFRSPFAAIDGFGKEYAPNTSFSLSGIIKGPKGYTAIIKPVHGSSYSVSMGETIANFYVESITDNQIILRLNEDRTVLKLGGRK